MKYCVKIVIIIILSAGFIAVMYFCKREDSAHPVVLTVKISDITTTSALSGGNITSDGGGDVTARGVCWNISTGPTIDNFKTTDGKGPGIFVSNLTNLQPGTIYYVKAYATNEAGTTYGFETSFTTVAITPILTTFPASDITTNSATSGGNITSDGGFKVTARGVCWDTVSNPTISDPHTTDGTGIGSFESCITGLLQDTRYYARAYATNSGGTAYGRGVSFTTFPDFSPIIFNPELTYGTVSDIDGNIYKTIEIGTQTWMAENLKTTKYNDGVPIPSVTNDTVWDYLKTPGYCWMYYKEDTYKDMYGAIYNYYAVKTGNLCPVGWHVSTHAEWDTLANYLGGRAVAGGKMKETGTTHWKSPNTGATNISGFTALPGGTHSLPSFWGPEYHGRWWCSDLMAVKWLQYNSNILDGVSCNAECGFSVRCMKDY